MRKTLEEYREKLQKLSAGEMNNNCINELERIERTARGYVENLKKNALSLTLRESEELKTMVENISDLKESYSFNNGFLSDVIITRNFDIRPFLKLGDHGHIRQIILEMIDKEDYYVSFLKCNKKITERYSDEVCFIDFDKKLFWHHEYKDAFYIEGLNPDNYWEKIRGYQNIYSLFQIKGKRVVGKLM